MNRKQKIEIIKDVLLGRRSVEELLPMRYDIVRLRPDDTEAERTEKVAQISANKRKANVTTIVVTYE